MLIADDRAMVREGFSVLLGARPDIDIVGEAADGRDAVERAEALRPDVVLMDVRMPVMSGLEATRLITGAGTARVLVPTTFDLDEYVYEALCAGASGFLLKSATGEALAEAVRVVAGGDALPAPSVTRRLIAHFARSGVGTGGGRPLRTVEELTERGTEVLALIAGGLSNAESGERLVVAEQTVKTHVSRILAKPNLRDRTQAAVHAYETGLVRPGSAR